MKSILVVTASIRGQEGESSKLAEQALERLREVHGELRVTRRDLSAELLSNLVYGHQAAFLSD